MQYRSNTTGLVSAVLAVMSNASPISQSALAVATSTPSFNSEYSSVAGTFTAVAAPSPTSTAAPSETFDTFPGIFRKLEVGPVLLEEPFRIKEPILSEEDLESILSSLTSTSTDAAATSTALHRYWGPHPHFGHGPVVPGRSFHPKSNITANRTSPRITVPQRHHSDPCKHTTLYWGWFCHAKSFFRGQHKTSKHPVLNHNATTPVSLPAPATSTATLSPSVPIYRGHRHPSRSELSSQKDIDIRELSSLDNQISMEEQKIHYFLRQMRQISYDLDHTLKFMDPHNNVTDIKGRERHESAAYDKIDSANRQMKIAEKEKDRLEKEREALMEAHGWGPRHF